MCRIHEPGGFTAIATTFDRCDVLPPAITKPMNMTCITGSRQVRPNTSPEPSSRLALI
jgi:hypothetical protein